MFITAKHCKQKGQPSNSQVYGKNESTDPTDYCSECSLNIVLYPAGCHKLYAKSSYALAIVVNVKQSIHTAKCPHMDLSQEPLVVGKALPTEKPSMKMNKQSFNFLPLYSHKAIMLKLSNCL